MIQEAGHDLKFGWIMVALAHAKILSPFPNLISPLSSQIYNKRTHRRPMGGQAAYTEVSKTKLLISSGPSGSCTPTIGYSVLHHAGR